MRLFQSLSHNVGVGGVTDEMTIHTHVLKTNKKQQKIVSLTLSVLVVVRFLFFFYWAY